MTAIQPAFASPRAALDSAIQSRVASIPFPEQVRSQTDDGYATRHLISCLNAYTELAFA